MVIVRRESTECTKYVIVQHACWELTYVPVPVVLLCEVAAHFEIDTHFEIDITEGLCFLIKLTKS